MLPPDKDIAARTPVWNVLQEIYMDTEVESSYSYIARTCAESSYSLIELEAILFNEVLPALRFNIFALPAPEWAGFEVNWLVRRILKKQRFGKRRPLILRRYSAQHCLQIAPLVIQYRDSEKG